MHIQIFITAYFTLSPIYTHIYKLIDKTYLFRVNILSLTIVKETDSNTTADEEQML